MSIRQSRPARRPLRAAAVAVAAVAATAVPAAWNPPVASAATAQLTILAINDFHGRVEAGAGANASNTLAFAAKVEELRATAGEANTLFVAAGDNIGASLFASAVQEDQPTIDILNVLEMDVSAVGNHEFDQGIDDLTDRVIGDPDPNALWDYLGANVYTEGTEDPVLDEYALFEWEGVTIGVIGVVTEETPALVSPGGIVGLEFGDPVDAVNRVAAQLSDDEEANGEADVIVASFHEGSPLRQPAGDTFQQAMAAGGAFAHMVNDLDPTVDVILNGHTNGVYAWDAPNPGGDTATRPIMQPGEYGTAIGKVVLTVDTDTGEVQSYTQSIEARGTITNVALPDVLEQYPRVDEVKTILDAALAEAAVVGDQVVGSVAADITTAFTGGSYVGGVYAGGARDNRAAESTLGNLVADSLLETLSDPQYGGAEIGVVNPGGLRAELFYARTDPPEEEDGIVRFAEANSVLPFVNNLWTTTLTGAQFKTMLEQQWQRNAQGNVPGDRPYLQLGLSSNVSYTSDPSRPEGERITSIWVNGAPIDPAGQYRIGSFSFLLQGGDNFHVFRQGTNTLDSGLIDRDAWIDYIEDHSPLSPDFARRSAVVTGLPPAWVPGYVEPTFAVSGLDLTSRGAPLNTSLDLFLDDEEDPMLEAVPIVGGAASIALDLPDDIALGDHVLTLVAQPSGTTVLVPIEVSDTIDLTLLGFNDFHGRVTNEQNLTTRFATTIEQQRLAAGEDYTLLWAAGDNVGASLFVSSVQEDQPAIDVLNALELDVSAVGNHEFDRGFNDLMTRIIGSPPNAGWPYLGANVYEAGTDEPALDEFATFEVAGVTVGVIGAVTQETPALVSPDGVEMLEFGDPVEAVNRVAAQLSDDNEANGEADVIIATFHEGSEARGGTLEDAMADSEVFTSMVEDLSDEVDAILNGHTNGQYTFSAPRPGGGTRPIMQAGEYATAVGRIVLTIDPAEGEVVGFTQQIIPTVATANPFFPRVADVAEIVADAVAFAAVIGNEPVGEVTHDITTAFAGGSFVGGIYQGGTRDDRARESTLSNLIADSLVATLSDPLYGGAEIGVVNPGGVRAELLFAGDTSSNPANTDGVVTFAEANAVLPFVNNLWTTTLTGAQFKTMLEQQWQRDSSGNVPSRSYLQLGLSENVSYTSDPARPEGDRITSIWIDGDQIDPEGEYRIGSFNFLLQGGDNFHVFRDGTDTADSGLVDRDAWIDYIAEESPLSPDFARRSAIVTGPSSVTAGTNLAIQVSSLDLTSLGSPLNLELEVQLDGDVIGTVPITSGTASVTSTVPAATTPGQHVLTLIAAPSGTTVMTSITVVPPTAPGVPTGVTGVAGNGSVTVSWLAPASDGGSAITGYTVTAAPGGAHCTTTGALSCTVNGLTNGTPYTFTVTATNAAGTSGASAPSAAVTPATVPGPPTGVGGVAGDAAVLASWAAPANNGGSAITGYTVTAQPGGAQCTTTGALSCAVSGLANGTAYTLTVTATNAAGTSVPSGASPSVTPTAIEPPTLGTGKIGPGSQLCFEVAGWPGDVAIVNLTPVLAAGLGDGQLIASGSTPPVASNVNFGPGTVDPNIAVASIGEDGKVCYANSPHSNVDLVVDHLGTISQDAITLATETGAPDRKVDTRIGLGGGLVAPGEVRCFTVAGSEDDVAMVNLTPVLATALGDGQLISSGVTPPVASNVNYGPGTVDPNVAFAPIGADGKVCYANAVHTSVHLVADHLATIDGDAFTFASDTGAPARAVDTRIGLGGGLIAPNEVRCFEVAGDPEGLAVVNLTPVLATALGDGQLITSGLTPPVASNVNYGPGTVNPNVALAPIGDDGEVCYANSSHTSVHLVADHLGTIDADVYTPATDTGAPARRVDTRPV